MEGWTKPPLYRLLENGSIYLPKVTFHHIYDDIDEHKDEKVTSYEIEEYVNRRVESDTVDFNFWANTTRFYGSINYVIASYGIWTTWNYVSIVFFYFTSPSCFPLDLFFDFSLEHSFTA